jgi:glycosyltransferase involved in cell wall biosynthesis
MKLGRSVRFYGYRDDVAALMSVCDAFLFPSIHEGLPVAVLEAGAAGLPVVGTLLPGLMEAVVDGSSALLHDVSDIEGMADSVIRVLSDRSLARSIGDAARAHVIRNFSDQTAAQRLLTVYEECLERARN